MATIHDVATKAGVSVATVSRYFNGGYVGAPTRASIEAAVQELGYRPNAVARALSAKSSQVIGLIVPSITNPFFPELAQAVEEECARRGFHLVLCNGNGSVDKEQQFIAALAASFADGIITATGNCGESYEKLSVPVVSVDRELGTAAPHVSSDNFDGGRMAFRCLERAGVQHPLFIGSSRDSTSKHQREEGFFSEAKLAGFPAPDILVAEEDDHSRSLAENAGLLERCDGVFAWNDVTAAEAIRLLHQLGRRVPEDCSVVGFDDVYIARLFMPGLTTIAQRIYEMGRAATELLMRMIDGEQLDGVTYMLGVELIERESTLRGKEGTI